MGRWKERKGAALKAALLFFAILQLLPAVTAEGPLLPPADLLLELRELVPDDFSFSVSYVITNIGGSVSRPCALSIWDEFDVLTGNGSQVLEHPLQELQPGRSVTVDLEWHPATPSVHRLWAFTDPENEVVEITKTNNIVFRTVSLPNVPDPYMSIDGLEEDNRTGTFFSGVPLEVKLLTGTEKGSDPSYYRFEMFLDNTTVPLRSWSGGRGSEPTFDVGALMPGTHTMLIGSSFAGVSLGTNALNIIVAPLPEWTVPLSDLEVSFDSELRAYTIRGNMDIPTLELLPEGENLTATSPITLFEQDGEVRIKAWVLPDMTTTFELELSSGMPYAPDGSPLKAIRTVFRDGSSLPDQVLLNARSHMVIDMAEHIELGPLAIGKGPDLRLDPTIIVAEGTFLVDLIIARSPNGQAVLTARADLDLQGSYDGTVFPDTLAGPGGAINVVSELFWRTGCELDPDGEWGVSEGPVLKRMIGTTDLTSPDWAPSKTYTSMSSSNIGPFSSVHLASWKGNQSALGMWQEGSSVLLRGGYKRMAESCIAPLYGGDRVIVWTEAGGSGGTTPEELSDRGLWWLTVDPEMFERQKATPLFPGAHLDMQPTIASAPNGSVVLLSWIRDQDMNMTTTGDRQLMVASYDGSNWSEPLDVRPNGNAPVSSTCLFTEGGVPVVGAVDIEGTPFIIPIWSSGGRLDRQGLISELLMPEGSKAIEVSALMPASGPGQRSGILMTRSGVESEDRCVLSVQTIEGSISLENLVLTRVDVIASSSKLIEGPCGDQLDSGYTAVMWREAGNGNGTLRMAGSPAGAGWDTWTPPLDLDPDLPMTPSFSFRAVEEGKFWTVMGIMLPEGSNTTLEPVRIGSDEITWACDIVSIMATAAEGYAPGDLATVKVTVVNRGLVPDGTASIHLMRTVRSREEGAVMEQHILSEMVQFTTLNERKELTFSVTIGDLQSGFRAFSSTPPGGLPWSQDEMYTSLSAYPDPVVTGLELEEGQPGENVTVKVGIINMGHSRLIEGPLVLIADGPTPPAVFGPGRMEPIGLRGMEGGLIVSSFNITLDPLKEVTYMFGFRPGNGTTSLWPEVRQCGWLTEVPKSARPLVIKRLPEPEVRIGLDKPFLRPDDPIDVEVLVYNLGTSGPFAARVGGEVTMLPDGLDYLEPVHELRIDLVNGSGGPLGIYNGRVDVPPPGGSVRTTFALEERLQNPGRYLLRARVSSGYDTMGTDGQSARTMTELHVLPEVALTAGSPEELLLPSRTSGFSVPITSLAPRTSWGTIVVLSNGRPEDGVALSDHLLIGIGPHKSSNAVLSLPLKKGSYLLSISVLGFASDSLSSDEGMVRTDTLLFEHQVVDQDDGQEKQGPDPGDVTLSTIVAGGALFVVLTIGAVFKLQGKDDDK